MAMGGMSSPGKKPLSTLRRLPGSQCQIGNWSTSSIGGAVNPPDEVNALLVYSESFGLTDSQARVVLCEVADAASNWEAVARRNGIAEAEITRFDRTLKHTIDAVNPS
jgi:serine/threonine-protein kinase HipA